VKPRITLTMGKRPTSAFLTTGPVGPVRDACRRLGIKHCKDVATGQLWLDGRRVHDVAAWLEQRKHPVVVIDIAQGVLL
jgi:hypothetical protein